MVHANSQRPADTTERVHTRVRALLRKAESTEFPAEAEALTAKAQDLLTRHALDEAMVVGGADGAAPGAAPQGAGPVVRPVPITATYAAGRAQLLAAVAGANRSTVVWDPAASTAMVVGFGVDLDAIDVLWRSLQAQAELAVAAAGPVTDSRGRSRTRSWRSAFWVAFAQRIGQRLDEQNRATVAEVAEVAEVAVGPSALLPVLASRQRQVDEAVAREFPRVVRRRRRVSNGDGWSAGHAAANAAHLQSTSGLAGGTTRRLGRG